MNIKQVTGYTAAQIRAMTAAQRNELKAELEDDNIHTGVVMVKAAAEGCASIIKALEALDDMHHALGHMPYEAIELRQALSKSCERC